MRTVSGTDRPGPQRFTSPYRRLRTARRIPEAARHGARLHDLQEADFLPGLSDQAFDISGTVPPDRWYGTLLKGVFNFQPDPTVLQVVVWLLYLIPTLALFLAPARFGRGRTTTTPVRDRA